MIINPLLSDKTFCLIVNLQDLEHFTIEELLEAAREGGFHIMIYSHRIGANTDRVVELSCNCRKKGILFLVEDDVNLAKSSNADGLHLRSGNPNIDEIRQRLGGDHIVGLEVSSYREAETALNLGIDYLCPKPIFRARSAPNNVNAVGCELVRAINRGISLPQYAFGGINLINAKMVFSAGSYGIIVDFDPKLSPNWNNIKN